MRIEESEGPAGARWLQGGQADHAGLSLERLPGLAFAFEQFGLGAPNALAPLFQSVAPGVVKELRPTTLFEFIGDREGRLAAALRCEELDARLLMIFGYGVVDAVVAAVFGDEESGRASRGAARPTRPPSGIETNLLAETSRLLAKALNAAFASFVALDLTFERLETLVDMHALGRRDMPAVAATLTIDALGSPVELEVLMPQSVILPMRKALAQDLKQEAATPDPRWAREMQDGVTKARVAVTAVLDELEMTLGDVAEFAVGQVLNLHGAGMGRVRLESGGHEMFWCKLGQGEGRYSLEVEEPIEPEKDPIEAARAL